MRLISTQSADCEPNSMKHFIKAGFEFKAFGRKLFKFYVMLQVLLEYNVSKIFIFFHLFKANVTIM